MKKLLFIAAFLWLNVANGQSVDWSPLQFNDDGIIEMVEVVELPDKSSEEIYTQVKLWMASYYKSMEDVVQVDDQKSGIIKGRALMTFYSKTLGKVFDYPTYYTIRIDIKDGKYRLSITDYIIKSEYGDYGVEMQFTDKMALKKNGELRDFPIAAKNGILEHWESIKSDLEKKIKEKSKDDW